MNIEQLNDKIKKFFPNEEFKVLEYTLMKEPFKIQCCKCGTIQTFQRAENFFRRKKGCNNCTETEEWKKQKLQFLNWLNSHPEFELVDDLTTIHKSQDYVRCKCTICGRIQTNKTIYNYYDGKSCYCQTQGRQKPQDLIELDYQDICLFLEPYVSATKPVLLENLKCHHQFRTAPAYLLHNPYHCPLCHSSIGERAIEDYLKKNNINYCREYVVNINSQRYRIDFFLPDYNLFIEYNGIQHYKPVKHFGGEQEFENQQIRDNKIMDYCKQIEQKLLIISYHDFNNINEILEREVRNIQ